MDAATFAGTLYVVIVCFASAASFGAYLVRADNGRRIFAVAAFGVVAAVGLFHLFVLAGVFPPAALPAWGGIIVLLLVSLIALVAVGIWKW